MALTAWRLVKARYAASAFDGEGARRFGGRWNEPGTALVYLGGSLALAALEVFVHLSARDTRLRFVAIPVTIPDSMAIERLTPNELPSHWRQEPPPDATKQLGTRWASATRAAVLEVPSVIVPNESNYLLNPLHPDFKHLAIGKPQPFDFDNRMWK